MNLLSSRAISYYLNLFVCLPGYLLKICFCLILSTNAKALEGGTVANAVDFPGLVMLSYDDIPNTFNFKNCSGIILEPRRVLTSASCVYTLATNPVGNILIPANKIHVHLPSQGIIGPFTGIDLKPTSTPSISVSSYVIHPLNSFNSGHHNLAVLYLGASLNAAPGYIYNGSNKFIGASGTALGWTQTESGNFPISNKYYTINKLSFAVVDGDTNIDTFVCYDNYVYTATVFCGGFRNSLNYLDDQDEGAPIFRSINARQAAIGILSSASHGLLYDRGYIYEKYARTSTMVNFIKQHAPTTQFWNESSVIAESAINIIPLLYPLLLNDE